MELPDAQMQNPACGACGSETSDQGDEYVCEDCQLAFDHDDLDARFLNPDVEPCGRPCDNWWHGDNRIRSGLGFDCGTCHLPAGHVSMHWTGCQKREAVGS